MDSFNQSNKSQKYQMHTKTADFKFTQYRFNTNICAQTANFIGDILNFMNITEYRCAYMQITEVIFFFTLTLILSHRIRITNAIWRIKKPNMLADWAEKRAPHQHVGVVVCFSSFMNKLISWKAGTSSLISLMIWLYGSSVVCAILIIAFVQSLANLTQCST